MTPNKSSLEIIEKKKEKNLKNKREKEENLPPTTYHLLSSNFYNWGFTHS